MGGRWFKVYLNGKCIDEMHYCGTAAELRRSLINHDGYDLSIIVRAC